MRLQNQISSTEPRVLIFPAQTPQLSGRPVHFLFSLKQADDILTDASVMPVPLAPPHIEGIAQWREQILPVVSLELCLGLEFSDAFNTRRLAVVRTPQKNKNQMTCCRIMVRMAAPIQMLPLPTDCSPVSNQWPATRQFIRGVYEWKNGWLIVVQMENVLWGAD